MVRTFLIYTSKLLDFILYIYKNPRQMRYIFLFLIFLSQFSGIAQSEQLAKNYIDQGQYEKALTIYQKLVSKNPHRQHYVLGLVSSFQELERFEEAEKVLTKAIESTPNNSKLLVELGHHYDIQSKKDEALAQYNKAIEVFNQNGTQNVYSLAQTFEKYNLLDQAIIIYEKGMVIDPRSNYNVQLAKIYGEQGNIKKMFDSYLSLLEFHPNYQNVVLRNFSNYITEDPSNEANITFRKLLIRKIQQDPNIIYNELLSWLFVQQKDYKKAFVQEKAIYKRKDENTQGLLNLARIAIRDKDIKSATHILDYILTTNAGNDTKLTAYKVILKAKTDNAPQNEYTAIQKEYDAVFNTYGKSRETIGLQIDYAHFIAFKLDKKQEAIDFLQALLDREQFSRFQTARIKMKIADILILNQKFNKALIYYTQVQNALKNNFLAQDARFKVAKTSYYKGDFTWAQTQLDVLKSSTSQLIANDAMELSLIISDNSLEDSTQTALKIFAKADLLSFQNKNKEAINTYEKILQNHKGEKIEDETLYRQAKLYENENEFEKAKVNYLKIIEFFPTDILIDDAYYWLAALYTTKLNAPEKAKELYEKILFNHADSIYYVSARKKYRSLRGDAIN